MLESINRARNVSLIQWYTQILTKCNLTVGHHQMSLESGEFLSTIEEDDILAVHIVKDTLYVPCTTSKVSFHCTAGMSTYSEVDKNSPD